MITLGLRLTFAGGRAVIGRLAMIAAAVTLGVTMLLGTLAGVNAVSAQNQRYAWLESDSVAPAPASGASADPVWWRLSGDYFDGQVIGRVDLAAGGPQAPVPPGLTHVPRPGEYFASPALAALLRHTPPAELAARYPGRLAGTIGRAGLPSPDSLLVVVGRAVSDVRSGPGAVALHAYSTVSPSDCHGCGPGIGLNENAMDLVLGVVAAALLFPVLIFVGTATRLSAARREQRFAAMRLVGATPRQISAVAAVEATVATAVGVALGFVAFQLVRGVIASIPFTGARFWPSDLALSLPDVLAVAIGVPAAAALAARIALRRVRISPLGVVRRTTPEPPRARRLVPLALGIGELGLLVVTGPPATGAGQTLAFLAGMIVVMVGLLVAGPWLTMQGARLLARRTRRPESLIAGRRLADDPAAAFRAISGLVLALFVGTVAISALAGFVAHRGTPGVDAAATSTFDLDVARFTYAGTAPELSVASVPAAVTNGLAAIPGVRATALLHTDVTDGPQQFEHPVLASCADLARLGGLGRCVPGAQVGRVTPYLQVVGGLARHVWPAAPVTVAALRARPVTDLLVGTDGSAATRESVRTVLENAYPRFRAPQTLGESVSRAAAQATTYARLAEVVVLASLPIAGCSLAVSAVSGLSERRRAFGLMRLAGVPLRRLRAVVALENALPMLAGAVAAIGMGLAAAELFLESQLGYSLVAPGPGYYIAVGAGIALALGVVASTLPFLGRITGPESARNE